MASKLLTPTKAQPKAVKGEDVGVLTAVLHLAPADLAGIGTTCRYATDECRAACLNVSGHGAIGIGALDDVRTGAQTNSVQAARIRKTREFFANAHAFVVRLAEEVRAHERRARKLGMVAAVRLNATSDIPWERVAPELFAMFPDVRWYDYTKYPRHARPAEKLPVNYSLTMSYSGHNASACLDALARGRNVAAVFAVPKGAPLPSVWHGFPVIDGDVNDARFLDPQRCIVGLRAKGRAKGATSRFVLDPSAAPLFPSDRALSVLA